MLVYYFVPFIVSNRYLLFWVSNGHNSVTIQNRIHVYMNFFHHKDLGNHLLQLCPKVVKHPVYCGCSGAIRSSLTLWRHNSVIRMDLKITWVEIITCNSFNMEWIFVWYHKCGFGGLGVACWPLVPKFAGSNPAEAVGFLRAKKSSAPLPSEGK